MGKSITYILFIMLLATLASALVWVDSDEGEGYQEEIDETDIGNLEYIDAATEGDYEISDAGIMAAGDFITLYSPKNTVYVNKNVPFNITTKEIVQNITYIDLTKQAGRELILCRGTACKNGVGNIKKKVTSFTEGYHNLLIKARTFTNVYEKSVGFTVDSKFPKMNSQYPKAKAYTNGTFWTVYSEDNSVNFWIMINNKYPVFFYSWKKLDALKTELTLRSDVSQYNGKTINYSIFIKDRGNHTLVVSGKNVNVDTVKPTINATYDTVLRKFDISISELSTLKYYDYSDGKWRSLCSKCKRSIKTQKFSPGPHKLLVHAVDYAGNSVGKEITFDAI